MLKLKRAIYRKLVRQGWHRWEAIDEADRLAKQKLNTWQVKKMQEVFELRDKVKEKLAEIGIRVLAVNLEDRSSYANYRIYIEGRITNQKKIMEEDEDYRSK